MPILLDIRQKLQYIDNPKFSRIGVLVNVTISRIGILLDIEYNFNHLDGDISLPSDRFASNTREWQPVAHYHAS